ncbi:MAG: c-type cytochrome domain-containing protein [Planctomycetota bacterium]
MPFHLARVAIRCLDRRGVHVNAAVWGGMLVAVFGALLPIFTSFTSAETPPKSIPKPLFEEHILPILKARCFRCHAGTEPANGLRVTSRAELLAGGDSGPAIRLGAAESSLLWVKLASGEMPKDGPVLSAMEKGLIRVWINDGAPSTAPVAAAGIGGTPSGEPRAAGSVTTPTHWSFLPPVRPAVPATRRGDPPTKVDGTMPALNAIEPDRSSPRTAVDAFVMEALQAKGLSVASDRSDRSSIRPISHSVSCSRKIFELCRISVGNRLG